MLSNNAKIAAGKLKNANELPTRAKTAVDKMREKIGKGEYTDARALALSSANTLKAYHDAAPEVAKSVKAEILNVL